uniref:Uncharacterized protein n=1 Tax=Anguilla anguilla TaxID=7936 RepID=A0A0E9R960_ANGAN
MWFPGGTTGTLTHALNPEHCSTKRHYISFTHNSQSSQGIWLRMVKLVDFRNTLITALQLVQ